MILCGCYCIKWMGPITWLLLDGVGGIGMVLIAGIIPGSPGCDLYSDCLNPAKYSAVHVDSSFVTD